MRESYISLRAINLTKKPISEDLLEPGGKVALTIQGEDGFLAEGTLDRRGVLSGMSKVHAELGLQPGDELTYYIQNEGEEALVILEPPDREVDRDKDRVRPVTEPEYETVFEKQELKAIHIEAFRPENLNDWEPETETDVYMAFGVLTEYTDYKYCCGASQEILRKLGYDATNSKPDAILISRVTDEYLIGEWKMTSSDFKRNHSPEDVDVLVCWHDDEEDQSVLPDTVVSLRSVAKLAATEAIEE